MPPKRKAESDTSMQQAKQIKQDPLTDWSTIPHHILNLLWVDFIPIPSNWKKISNPEVFACNNSFPLFSKSPRDYWHLHKKKINIFHSTDEEGNYVPDEFEEEAVELSNWFYKIEYDKKLRQYSQFVEINDPNSNQTEGTVPRQPSKYSFPSQLLHLRLVCKHWKEAIDISFPVYRCAIQLRKKVDQIMEEHSSLNARHSIELLGVLSEQVRILQHQHFVFDQANKFFSKYFPKEWNPQAQNAVKQLVAFCDMSQFQRQGDYCGSCYDGDVFSSVTLDIPAKNFRQTFTARFISGWDFRDDGWDTEVSLQSDKERLYYRASYRGCFDDMPRQANWTEIKKLSSVLWGIEGYPPKMTVALLMLLCGLSHWDLLYAFLVNPKTEKEEEEEEEEPSQEDEEDSYLKDYQFRFTERFRVSKEVPNIETIQQEFKNQTKSLLKELQVNMPNTPHSSNLIAVAFFLFLKQINQKQIQIAAPKPPASWQQEATNVKDIRMNTFFDTYLAPGEYSGLNAEQCSFKMQLKGGSKDEDTITFYSIITDAYYGISGPVTSHKMYLKVGNAGLAQKLQIPEDCYVMLWSWFSGSEEYDRFKVDLALLDSVAKSIGWNPQLEELPRFERTFHVETKLTAEQKCFILFLEKCAGNPNIPLLRYLPESRSEDHVHDRYNEDRGEDSYQDL